jgi:hypothetical protein
LNIKKIQTKNNKKLAVEVEMFFLISLWLPLGIDAHRGGDGRGEGGKLRKIVT